MIAVIAHLEFSWIDKQNPTFGLDFSTRRVFQPVERTPDIEFIPVKHMGIDHGRSHVFVSK